MNWTELKQYHNMTLSRVPGLPIRESAGSSNNLAQMCPKLSATDMTIKDILWAFVFGSRTEPIWAPSQLSLCNHTPTAGSKAISRFSYNFFPKWPLIFCQHTIHQVIWPSRGTLTPSQNFGCLWLIFVRWSQISSGTKLFLMDHLSKAVPSWRRKRWRKRNSNTMRMQNDAKLATGPHQGYTTKQGCAASGRALPPELPRTHWIVPEWGGIFFFGIFCRLCNGMEYTT